MAILYRFSAASENAATLYFDLEFATPERIKGVSLYLAEHLFKGKSLHPEHAHYWDIVPANHNVTVFFNPLVLSMAQVKKKIRSLMAKVKWSQLAQNNQIITHTLPVYYGADYALDLSEIACVTGLEINQIIQIHSHAIYEVAALGFAPGFAYLNGLPEALRLPRLAQPRQQVQAGSLAIAEGQSAIYPCDSPAGWNIIGHCPIPLFSQTQGAVLSMGDRVVFREIDKTEHAMLLLQHQGSAANPTQKAGQCSTER